MFIGVRQPWRTGHAHTQDATVITLNPACQGTLELQQHNRHCEKSIQTKQTQTRARLISESITVVKAVSSLQLLP